MTEQDQTRARIEAVWRIESTRLIATLSRMVRDIGLAEELAQDALVAALEKWPHTGVPDKPGAWLTTTAKNRAIDKFRRDERLADRTARLARQLATDTVDDYAEANEDVGDDLLRLIFTACHPVLATPAKVALTLRVVGGLTTGEIARAFMVPESTVAQRIVRAKRALANAEVPFEMPQAEEIPARLASVLEVLYLIFNEGYTATAGDDLLRPELCHDAIRMARILVQVSPGYAEAHGLSALLELQGSRLSARVTSTGEPVLLADQDRAKWDRLLIRRGLAALAKAESLSDDPGVYTLQAAIAACHARAVTVADTDWREIAAIYDRLVAVSPSPVVELNRAVAVSRAYGPRVGLDIVDALAQADLVSSYHLLPAVRGDLLARLDRAEEARDAFLLAADLTDNQVEQRLLRARADAVSG